MLFISTVTIKDLHHYLGLFDKLVSGHGALLDCFDGDLTPPLPQSQLDHTKLPTAQLSYKSYLLPAQFPVTCPDATKRKSVALPVTVVSAMISLGLLYIALPYHSLNWELYHCLGLGVVISSAVLMWKHCPFSGTVKKCHLSTRIDWYCNVYLQWRAVRKSLLICYTCYSYYRVWGILFTLCLKTLFLKAEVKSGTKFRKCLRGLTCSI